MSNKPFIIAAILTLLALVALVPLYLLGSQQFQLTLTNLSIVVLSLFVLLLICAFWTNTVASGDESGSNNHSLSDERECGNVKWFNTNKGFGFITRDSGEDIFVHFRSIRGKGHRALREGQRVDFIVSGGEKGLQAEDVEVIR